MSTVGIGETSIALTLLLIGLGILLVRYGLHWQKSINRIKQNTHNMAHGPAHEPAPKRVEPYAPLPRISVLVAAWNEERDIRKFLKSFATLDYPNKELVLIAGGDDKTWAIVSSWMHPQVTLLQQKRGEGKLNALKRGLTVAKGSIIYLTDADCRLETNAFLHVVCPIVSGQELAVTGRFQPLTSQLANPFVYAQWKKRQFEELQANHPRYLHSLSGANSAIDRTLLETCWQSLAEQPFGEDHALALLIRQAGHKILEAPSSYVKTRFPETMGAYIQQQSRWLRTWLLLDYRFGDSYRHSRLLTAIKTQIMLSVPILCLVFVSFFGLQSGLFVCIAWLLGWVHFFMPYGFTSRWTTIGKQSQKIPLERHLLRSLVQLMLADFFSRAVILPKILFRQWRLSW